MSVVDDTDLGSLTLFLVCLTGADGGGGDDDDDGCVGDNDDDDGGDDGSGDEGCDVEVR